MVPASLKRLVGINGVAVVSVLVALLCFVDGANKLLHQFNLLSKFFVPLRFPKSSILMVMMSAVEMICSSFLIAGRFKKFAALGLAIISLVSLLSSPYPIYLDSGFWAITLQGRSATYSFFATFFLTMHHAGYYNESKRSGLT